MKCWSFAHQLNIAHNGARRGTVPPSDRVWWDSSDYILHVSKDSNLLPMPNNSDLVKYWPFYHWNLTFPNPTFDGQRFRVYHLIRLDETNLIVHSALGAYWNSWRSPNSVDLLNCWILQAFDGWQFNNGTRRQTISLSHPAWPGSSAQFSTLGKLPNCPNSLNNLKK
jgi:hypothetical protein